MQKSNARIQVLLQNYFNNLNTETENEELWSHIITSHNDQELMQLFPDAFSDEMEVPENALDATKKQTILNYIYNHHLLQASHQPKTLRLLPKLAAIAAAVALIISGVWFYAGNPVANRNSKIANQNDIKPGKNTATITLPGGSSVQLSDAKSGVVIDASKITYSDGTTLEGDTSSPGLLNGMTTITTPRGGTYQVVLPDGTKVFLNADSKLEFPGKFLGGERRVKLTGEAYFVVVHNSKMPFKVESTGQTVEDIGTEFNINAYADEHSTKTTLVEGSAKVNEVILKPNQQSSLNGTRIKVEHVDTELFIAWKNNQFVFEQDDIRYIMRMISRWYNVEIVYLGELPVTTFSGSVSRFANVSEVLRPLESTGQVKFKIEGTKILVSR
ncbi:FecR family protein [Pedobacter heparinus]|uniref:FecR protein n=1 Tax=Pedobacter heparinus (strain ATCC 13125 / DSM 2366 / CIP 104194 / JCM 7457 / NBRC 12017 / NCIMB 9290 / NRRL B-14731 / HIM 762-3) TaxID=485917 RepID=C6XVT3_PEDHD|nr:FecR family protein [Pedobacter heparinus]ACU06158.1 FecR protein [Pedobacter heparinus DSM 2366]